MNLGTAYQAMGNNPKAAEAYKRSIALDPKLADAHYFLGTCYEGLKQVPAAIAEYRKYLQLQPAGQYAADVKARLKDLAPAGRR
jgi:tetratricopeptide (TPR) repeat protein